MKAQDQYNLPEVTDQQNLYSHSQSRTLEPDRQNPTSNLRQQFLSPGQQYNNDRDLIRNNQGFVHQTMFQNQEHSPQVQKLGNKKNSQGSKVFKPYQYPVRLNSAGLFSNRHQNKQNKLRISKDVLYLSEAGESQNLPQHQTNSLLASEGHVVRRVRAYNKIIQDFKNKYYRKQITPNKSKLDVETLYQENIQLKFQLNQLEKAHKQQNTQNQLLNNDLERQFSLILNWYLDKAKGHGSDSKATQILVMNLKRDYDEALKDIRKKDEIIDNLEKNKKITKIRELEEERSAYMGECIRLHNLLTKFKSRYGSQSPKRSEVESNLKALAQEAQEKTILADEAMQNIQQYEAMIQELQNQLDKYHDENQSLSEENQQLNGQIQKMEEVMLKQSKELEALIKQREADQEELENAYENHDKIVELEQQAKRIKDQMVDQETELKKLRKKEGQDGEEIKRLKEGLKKMEKEKDELGIKLSKLETEQAKGKILNEKVERKRDKIKNLKEKLMDLEDKIAQKEEKITYLELKLDDQNALGNGLGQADNYELEELKSQYENEIKMLKKQLEQKQTNIQNLEGDLGQVDQKIQEKDETIMNLRKQIEQITLKSQDIDHYSEKFNESQKSSSRKSSNKSSTQQEQLGSQTKLVQVSESEVEKLKEMYELQLQDKDQRIYDLELQLQEAKHPIQKTYNSIDQKEEFDEKLEKQEQQFKEVKEQLNQQIEIMEAKLEENQKQEKKQEELIKKNTLEIEEMKNEKLDLSNALCDKIQRCVHIINVYTLEGMIKYLQEDLAKEEKISMEDLLAIQFGINKFEAKYLKDSLNFDDTVEDLAQKLVEKFCKPLELSREMILDIGQKIQQNIPISNFEQFLLWHNLPPSRMIHHIQIDTILKPYLNEEERYKLIIHLLRYAKNFHKVDAQRLIRIVNPSQYHAENTQESDNEQAQNLQKQIPVHESSEILQLGAGRASQITSTNPLDMSHQDKPTIQLKIQQNDSFKMLTHELSKQNNHFRRLIQIFHNSEIYPGREVEVVILKDLFSVIQKMNLSHLLQGEGKQQIMDGLNTLEAIHAYPNTKQQIVVLGKLIEGLQYLGYKDLEKPKSKKNFDFEGLDVKSIRVMNRLCYYILRKEIPIDYDQSLTTKLSIIFRPVLFQCLVKTLSKEETVILIQKDRFYKRLVDIGIRKGDKDIPQLSYFLQIDSAYPHLLLFKKLARAIDEFSKNEHFRMIGTKRARLEDQKRQLSVVPEVYDKQNEQEEEYEYYEEEEVKEQQEESQPRFQTFNEQQVNQEIKPLTQEKKSSGILPQFGGHQTYEKVEDKAPVKQEISNEAPKAPNQEDEEYEYYDEGEEEQVQENNQIVTKPVQTKDSQLFNLREEASPVQNSGQRELEMEEKNQLNTPRMVANQESDYEYYEEEDENKIQREVEQKHIQIVSEVKQIPIQEEVKKEIVTKEESEYEYYEEEEPKGEQEMPPPQLSQLAPQQQKNYSIDFNSLGKNPSQEKIYEDKQKEITQSQEKQISSMNQVYTSQQYATPRELVEHKVEGKVVEEKVDYDYYDEEY